MLYDNSQLARVYLHAWILTSSRGQAVTGNGFYRTITEEILDYVVREMTEPGGVKPRLAVPAGATAHRTSRAVI